MEEETARKLRYYMAELERFSDTRKGYQRRYIMDTDPNAPVCINCRHCQQQGFLFICPIFQLTEDEKVVGVFGIVYYRRKGHKPRTYSNVPMKSDDCEAFEPLLV